MAQGRVRHGPAFYAQAFNQAFTTRPTRESDTRKGFILWQVLETFSWELI